MRIESLETVASAILAAPGWARVGITVPSQSMREEAALELARAILKERQEETEPSADDSQLSLSF